MPSQLPAQAVPWPVHEARPPRGAPVIGEQVPLRSWRSQASQLPLHGLSQQVPSTHRPEAQSVAAMQAAPSAASGVPMFTSPAGVSPSGASVVWTSAFGLSMIEPSPAGFTRSDDTGPSSPGGRTRSTRQPATKAAARDRATSA
jgi:hypothetical protein